MSLFDLFRKKNTDIETSADKKELNQDKALTIAVRENASINLHDDLKDLIWFADGPLKNYENENIEKNTFDYKV